MVEFSFGSFQTRIVSEKRLNLADVEEFLIFFNELCIIDVQFVFIHILGEFTVNKRL